MPSMILRASPTTKLLKPAHPLVFRASTFVRFAARPLTARVHSKFIIIPIPAQLVRSLTIAITPKLIHVSAFRCPWPRCGREFNVNSNMRRHLRNHNISSGQEVPDDGIRRRRRRSSANSLQSPITTGQQSASGPRTVLQGNPSHHQAAPPQYSVPPHLSEASHHYMRYRVYDYPKDHKGGMDSDEAEEYPPASGDPHRHMRMPVSVTRGLQAPVIVPHGAPQRHSGLSVPQEDYPSHHRSHSGSSGRMLMRALTPGSSFHSSSPSPSPSPSLSPTSSSFNSPPPSTYASPAQSPALLPRQRQIQYSPSMPYLRGARDSNVSTALRPAFNSGGHTVGPRH
jgi:hypothetical protein